jgi:uncharacterized protein with HEPN domain
MSKIDDATRLRHMRDAAIEAVGFICNRTRTNLDGDRMLTLALVKDIEIIGEAAGKISTDCRTKYPEIPWVQMIGMRNRLTHAYFEIDLDIIWEVVVHDLPPLVTELEKIIPFET